MLILLVLFLSCGFVADGVRADSLSPAGENLRTFLISQAVETHWLPKSYINWRTGDPIHPTDDEIQQKHLPFSSHCSDFVAAVSERLQITMLNPETSPDGHRLLANQQAIWLRSKQATELGWHEIALRDSEALANQGQFVVASEANPNPAKSGHIAVVVPDPDRSPEQIETLGPIIMQAGSPSSKVPSGNVLRTDTVSGFDHHDHGNLKLIRFYAHEIKAIPKI